jgi:hypothetical protein
MYLGLLLSIIPRNRNWIKAMIKNTGIRMLELKPVVEPPEIVEKTAVAKTTPMDGTMIPKTIKNITMGVNF